MKLLCAPSAYRVSIGRKLNLVHQIAYVSLSEAPLEAEMLSEIMAVSQRNNTRDGISGVLMYHDLEFFQVLEGKQSLVEQCYKRIQHDPRHSSISLMWKGASGAHAFPTWAMGYVGPDDIALHSSQRFAALVDLKDAIVGSADSDNIALALAREVFRSFSGADGRVERSPRASSDVCDFTGRGLKVLKGGKG